MQLLRLGERNIAKMVAVRWPRWPPCPYMIKPLKIFSRTEKPRGWIFAQIIGDGRSTKVAKILVVHWHLTFLWGGQVCFPMHLYGCHTFVWENVENFKWLLLWSLRASVAQISCGASLGQRNERLLKWSWSIDQDGRHAHIYGKNL